MTGNERSVRAITAFALAASSLVLPTTADAQYVMASFLRVPGGVTEYAPPERRWAIGLTGGYTRPIRPGHHSLIGGELLYLPLLDGSGNLVGAMFVLDQEPQEMGAVAVKFGLVRMRFRGANGALHDEYLPVAGFFWRTGGEIGFYGVLTGERSPAMLVISYPLWVRH